jgi:hypothetical protein
MSPRSGCSVALEPGTDYKIEIQSIEKSGNQTISELTFRVS